MNRVLAEPWMEHEKENLEIKVGDYRMGEVRMGEKLVMACDIQEAGGFHAWSIVRAWDSEGKSRLVWAGRLETWGDIQAKAEEFGVESKSVFCDSGDQTRDVYLHCCKNGWIALVGSDKTSFSEIIGQQKIQRPFSRIANGDPFSGKATGSRAGWKWKLCPVWRWSNPAFKDILSNLLKIEGFIAQDTPLVWHEHIGAEAKIKVKNPMTGRERFVWKQIGKNNHLLDAECMGLVGAALHGRLKVTPADLAENLEE